VVDDLPDRTERFAADIRVFVRGLPKTVSNLEDVRQLVRSSGSVAANLIEADNALGDKDKIMRFRICRKEARESGLWLRLLFVGEDQRVADERDRLNDESAQLMKIFSAILRKLKSD
jgi:four helix bundle protein